MEKSMQKMTRTQFTACLATIPVESTKFILECPGDRDYSEITDFPPNTAFGPPG